MNNILSFKLSVLGISVACVMLSQATQASTETNDKYQVLPAINLEATKNTTDTISAGQVSRKSQIGILGNKDAMDTPFSTASYTAKYIEDHQAKSVAEALASEPSVRNYFGTNSLGEYFNIRGLNVTTEEFAWNGLYGLSPHNRTPTEFLERVEVLRGTSAMLYGMSLGGSVGGTVNLIPKRAKEEPITRFTTSYTSKSNVDAHLDVGHRFGEGNKFGVRVNAVKGHGDTTLKGQTEDRTLGSIALDYRGDRLRTSLDAYYIKEKYEGGMPLMAYFTTSSILKAPKASTNIMQGAYATSETKAVIGHAEYDFIPNWTVYASGGTKEQESHGAIANNALCTVTSTDGSCTANGRNITNITHTSSGELGVRGQFKTGVVDHNLVLSGNVEKQDTDSGYSTVSWKSNIYSPVNNTLFASDPTFVPKTKEVTLSGIALADNLSFVDGKYQLLLGTRFQNVKSQSWTNSSTAITGSASYKKSAVTPAVGFVVKPWNNSISLYGNYIEGLSQGDQVTATTATNYGQVFAPYKTKQYELGAKWENGNFRNTLSIYQINKPSMIYDKSSNSYNADGEQRNRGIEWTTAGNITKDVRLLGGVSYIDAITTKTASGTYNGNRAYGVPHWQSNLGLEWDILQLQGLTLTTNTVYTDSEYVDTANTKQIPSWFRWDLGARYITSIDGHKTTFIGGVENVMNKNYWTGVYAGYYLSEGAPRTLKLSMSFDF
ncbi:TonB-dependent receptor [Acinetobacter nectaris]|uniref:TonB-dependent receptor n=1 Tax=Acinetobacter nectaris TaxID=1219382 RepID=UPI001EFFAB11|nr:TonB-dependent siderophore receptor [Acinetobacter nectaris]MCF8998231.1 TonB-dependent siderophore receptor [Acinetobacter nectaris]MCF9026843.1 TonB-dependent siderophore receptor [Acinetobacter nectaris]